MEACSASLHITTNSISPSVDVLLCFLGRYVTGLDLGCSVYEEIALGPPEANHVRLFFSVSSR